MWESGTEEAFTVVPNFLVTGILALLAGTAMIVWSARFLHRPDAARGFLLIGLLIFLVGGGIGMLVFLLFGWSITRRLNLPPAWWSVPNTGRARIHPGPDRGGRHRLRCGSLRHRSRDRNRRVCPGRERSHPGAGGVLGACWRRFPCSHLPCRRLTANPNELSRRSHDPP